MAASMAMASTPHIDRNIKGNSTCCKQPQTTDYVARITGGNAVYEHQRHEPTSPSMTHFVYGWSTVISVDEAISGFGRLAEIADIADSATIPARKTVPAWTESTRQTYGGVVKPFQRQPKFKFPIGR